MDKNPDRRSGIKSSDHISESQYLKLVLKFLVADPDPGSETLLNLDPGSWMEKFESKIRNKNSGSATLIGIVKFFKLN
jgi:hypothetical protein